VSVSRAGWATAPAALVVLAACAGSSPAVVASRSRAAATIPMAAPAIGPAEPWRFDVAASAGARELAVDAVIHARAGEALGVEGAARFLSGVEVSAGGPYRPLTAERDAAGEVVFHLPACPPEGCRVRYRFALAEAARRVDDISCAEEVDGAYLTSPSAWLLHPADPADGQPFELRVTTAPGATFTTGLLPSGSAPFALPPAAYSAEVSDLPNPTWAVFGDLHLLRVDVEDEAVDVAVLPGAIETGEGALVAWVSSAARAVRAYYGRASIRRALLVVVPGRGRGVGFARTLGNGGATIVAHVGRGTTAADFASSWELIHELLHVSFPNMPREQAWLEEGMATYVEPLLRARLGLVPVEQALAHLHERMPFGLPDRGDEGLDRTHTWGRTYWGGALFYLLADVAIRERTGNRRSLDDALRAVLAAGGNVSQRWEVDDVLATGDAATGVPVLRELYAKMATAPAPVDLEQLWRRLGVGVRDGRVVLDEAAELAGVRRGMTGR
jgi:predicted metalloprotease with PDZ domain